MKNKTFKYKNYGDCYFNVGNYVSNKQSMSINIVSVEGKAVTTATVNMKDYLYEPNTATIKNYSENAGITKFLSKLGIIEKVYSTRRCHPYALNSETIDYCLINIDKLKKYSKQFNYEWNI